MEGIYQLLDTLSYDERLQIIETLLEKYVDISDPLDAPKGTEPHVNKGNCSSTNHITKGNVVPVMTCQEGKEDAWIDNVAKHIKLFQEDRIDALAPDEEIVIPKFSPAVESFFFCLKV
jgi:hypothetical protein